jgi:uracil phosphoribosyltransferase
MRTLRLITHPLIQRDLTILRDRSTPTAQFRDVLRRLSHVMAFEATRDLRLRKRPVRTPLERTVGHRLADDIVIVPVLRAGLGLVDGFLALLPEARVGHVGLYRNEDTLEPVDYYSKFPRRLGRSVVFLLDPMLATGGSGSAAITFLKRKGARDIRFVSLVAAPEGVRRIARDHPDVPILTASLDRQLNRRGYILPGLGDAGDRVFGTE